MTEKAGPDQAMSDAHKIIAEVAAVCGRTVDALMEDAAVYLECGWQARDNSKRYEGWDDWPAFWRAYHVVKQLPMPDDFFDEWGPYWCS